MKRILSLLLALAILLSLCACGAGGEASDSTKESAGEALAETESALDATPKPDLFADLPEEYALQLPIYTRDSHTVTLLDTTYHYSAFEHDAQGRVTYWKKAEGDRASFGYSREYNAQGQVISETYHHSLYGYTDTFTYNDQGLLDTRTNTDAEDPTDITTFSYTYNENGLEDTYTRYEAQDPSDTIYNTYTYELNDRGWIIKSYEHDANGRGGFTHNYEYEYNDAGQLIYWKSYTIDEGLTKYIYEDTFEYNPYGFPILNHINNSYDYKNDTNEWDVFCTYAVTGQREIASPGDEWLQPVSAWDAFEEAYELPTPESALGLDLLSAEGNTYRYAIPTGEAQRPEVNLEQWMQTYVTPYTVQAEANEVLWRYEAILTQLLGLEVSILENTLVVTAGRFTLATLAVEFADGHWQLVVRVFPNRSESGDNILFIEQCLQGTWAYFHEDTGYGEILEFDNGQLYYTSYVAADRSKDSHITGTYRITDENLITTLNDFDTHFDYELKDGRLSFSWFIESGADAGNTRIFRQLEQGELDPDYDPAENAAPEEPVDPDNSIAAFAAARN